MAQTLSPIAIAAIFLVVFPLFWCLLFWLIGQLGGWSSLAESYATDRQPSGETFSWVSGKLNFFSSYNNCLTVSVSREGVLLRPMPLFRFGHKAMYFPWDSIEIMGVRREIFRYGTILEVKTDKGVHPVTLYGRKLSDSFGRHGPPRLTEPPKA
jgi:hypothetical protein